MRRGTDQANGEGGCEGEAAGLTLQLLQQGHHHDLPQRLLLVVREGVLQPR